MPTSNRRSFLRSSALAGAGAGYFVAAGGRTAWSNAATERLNVACIAVGGKGDSDSSNAALFGNVIAICDIDRDRLEKKSQTDGFKEAEHFTDYRELLAKHGKNIDICTISTSDHMHAPATLDAMRLGISCYTQKPLTRTIYEARLLAQVAKESGVCTQMGNQGSASNSSREAIAQLRSGVLGPIKEVHVWSNRPGWPQGPGRRMDIRKYQTQTMAEVDSQQDATTTAEKVAEIVAARVKGKRQEIAKALEGIDWQAWLGVAPAREFWPGLYHHYLHRGWWDFGTGALGDMACHMLAAPFAGCSLRDPVSVVARSTGHDFDSFPAGSTIRFDFPETPERPAIVFWWYDRKGNKPPMEVFAKWGIDKVPDSGVLVVGEKGAFYSPSDTCHTYELRGVEKVAVDFEKADDQGKGMDVNNMYELFRAKREGDPMIAQSNFISRAGPLTETILLGNLAVWAAAQGGPDGAMGDWGEKIEWDAVNLKVTNLDQLKTPRVADLIKPTYPAGYRLD